MNWGPNDSSSGGEPTEVTVKQVHQLLEEQANKSPHATAVCCGEETLTYEELNRRANKLAWYLKSSGIGPETPVALCLERSLDMVVAIVAVLKAGGAYVPIDLAYPRERLAFMLEDTKAPVLLTQQRLTESLPANSARVVCIDTLWEEIAAGPSENPPTETTGENAAYIIFTSGSTGKPKGVLVSHRNVARLFTATQPWFRFSSSDVWTLFHSYAFDFSVWEVWGALIYGGRLVVVPYLTSRSPAAFYELLGREQVTVLNQTPSAFRQLIWAESSAPEKQPLRLRYIIFGGEALELQSLRPWFDVHGDARPLLVNMYGITETTVHVTYRPIRRIDVDQGLGSVIGVPIPDLQLHLLDENLQPVPNCAPGELFVGGSGVARGYLNRPELTQARFIPDPFSTEPGARLYRSGDLAQRLANGELEYLGRADQQIKIRGFRIELGEIEAVLNQHPQVRESVVTALEGTGGEKRLAAYIVARQETDAEQEQPLVSQLREHLGKKLPTYMIPAAYVFLKALPLTPNGKVDRKALPLPTRARPGLKDTFVPARSGPEQILERIWSNVLEIEPIGINDNFFELGGDSIRSIALLAQAQQQGLTFTLHQLFCHPTIAGLVQCLSSGQEKAEFVATAPFSLISPEDRASLPPDIEDAYPMIKLQTGMFYYNEVNPASAVYHDVFSFKFNMPLVSETLAQAIQLLVDRHPVLRTSFHIGEFGEPMQLVHRHAQVPFTVHDLRQLSPEEQLAALCHFINVEKRSPFQRTVAPLLRFHVQILSDQAFQFICSFHHVILDGWSLAELIREVLEDYTSLIQGTGKTIPAPRLHYRDFVALEREAIASETCRKFWREQISDVVAQVLPRWPKSLCAGGLEQVRGPEVEIPADIFEGLRELARQAAVPLKSVLLAAHQFVMGTLQGQTDVVSGLICNGRPEELDGDKVIGLFLNTLPIRLKLDGGTWSDLVKSTFAAEQAIIPNRRFPLAEVHELNAGESVFESAFDFVHFHVYKHLHGYKEKGFLEGHYFEANNLTSLTTFMLDVTSTQLQMHIDYDPNLVTLEQIKAIDDYYMTVLRAMATAPESRYEDICALSPQEKEQMLVAWNATQTPYPKEKCIHELFEAHAERTPDAIAIHFEDEHLTYGELNRRADCLAICLRQAGVGPDILVGICLERSLNLVVGLLGILKAGGAYVPLDPAYPRDRLAYMISEAQLPVIVTERGVSRQLPNCSARTVLVDAEPSPGAYAPSAPSHGGNLAYVIYTSGSTGKPKGVQITHRSVVNLLSSIAATTAFSEKDHLLAVTTVSFDIAGLEIYLPLITGAQLTIASQKTAADGPQLAALLQSSDATVMQATPVTWRMLIESGWTGQANLKIFCGGEALSRSLAEALEGRGAEVWNLYGPTETTIWSAAWKVTQGDLCFIGRPLANTQIYILDSRLHPVPPGVTGEIYIGGDGLARGYLNRPDLTAERFIPDPFNPSEGNRLYRTGDLGRFRYDGLIECLGRVDHQVKIRGFRIELGEIESVLRQAKGIKDALVMAREDIPGNPQLVAYLLPEGGVEPSIPELRKMLQATLPDYMVPVSYVSLDAFPITPAGKVDRRALPAPGIAGTGFRRIYAAPRTPLEFDVAKIWQEVFHIEQIGIEDNFFDLGGHSLTAVRVIVRVRERFGVELPLAALFNAPTVSGLVEEMLNQMLTTENGEFGPMAKQVAGLTDEEAKRLLEADQPGAR